MQRDTTYTLFLAIIQRLKTDETMRASLDILDYYLPRKDEPPLSGEETQITKNEFNILPLMDFGCEGIYITCALDGMFDDSGKQFKQIGTLKTLRSDPEACRLMGVLCGGILQHGTEYVNENIERYLPERHQSM